MQSLVVHRRRWLAQAAAFDWTRRASGIFVFWAGGLAILGFTLAWWALSLDWNVQHPDVGFYQGVGEAIARGLVPYRDFDPAYPPAALPMLALPSLLGAEPGRWETYAVRFEHLMLLVGWLAVLGVLFALIALKASRQRAALALAFVAVSPILVGSIIVARFDLWPAALTVAALGAVIAGRERLGSAGLGVAIMAKVYPVVLVPLVGAYVWRRLGPRAAAAVAIWTAAGAAAAALPFLVVAPAGLWASLLDFVNRPLQVESAGATVLWIAHEVAGLRIEVLSGFGSDNLVGPWPDLVVAVQSILLAAALIAVWARFARVRNPSAGDLAVNAAATLCAYVLFGKVLSGQYLIWLVPLVALVRGPRGVLAAVLLGAALVLTQQWYPGPYTAWVYGLDGSVAWIVLARNTTLALLVVSLVAPASWATPVRGWLERRRGRPPVRVTARPVPAGGGSVAAQPAVTGFDRHRSEE